MDLKKPFAQWTSRVNRELEAEETEREIQRLKDLAAEKEKIALEEQNRAQEEERRRKEEDARSAGSSSWTRTGPK